MKTLISVVILLSATVVAMGCAAGQSARAGKTVGNLIAQALGAPREDVEKKEEEAKSRLLVIIDPNNPTELRIIILPQ